MKSFALLAIAAIALGALVGESFAATGGTPPAETASSLSITSFTAVPRRNLLRGSVVNRGQVSAEASYTMSRIVRRRLIPVKTGKMTIAVGQTGSVTVRLPSTTTSGRFRMVVSDASGKVCDVKYATLTSGNSTAQPYVVKYRTLGGARVVLSDRGAKDAAARTKAEERANAQAAFLQSCGFVTEVKSTVDRPTPQRPTRLNRIMLYAQLEQTQTRRFNTLAEAEKFAADIRACNDMFAEKFEIQVINELEQRREQQPAERPDGLNQPNVSQQLQKINLAKPKGK